MYITVHLCQEHKKERILSINEITEKIIGASYEVANTLGSGFLEKVYENALSFELKNQGLEVEQQYPLPVMYKGFCVGDYVADLYVESSVIVELKSTKATENIHRAQVLNYLKASNKKIGLLINFGTPRISVERIVN